MRAEEPIARFRALCADGGFNLDRADASLVERMCLLAEHTETVADAERMVAGARAVFRRYEAKKPFEAFSEAERRIVILGNPGPPPELPAEVRELERLRGAAEERAQLNRAKELGS